MGLPLLDPLRDAARTAVEDAGDRAMATLVTAALAVVAAGLFLAAILVALSRVIGFPLAAGLLGAVFAGLALAVYLSGRARARRRAERMARATERVTADIALAKSLVRSAGPILPVAAFLGAFFLARRRR
jgi:preprotein translocase subunit SecF